jgi:hypothetical protein
MKSMKLIALLCILFVSSGLFAKEVDSLYVKLHKKALTNLKNMPSYAKIESC